MAPKYAELLLEDRKMYQAGQSTWEMFRITYLKYFSKGERSGKQWEKMCISLSNICKW